MYFSIQYILIVRFSLYFTASAGEGNNVCTIYHIASYFNNEHRRIRRRSWLYKDINCHHMFVTSLQWRYWFPLLNTFQDTKAITNPPDTVTYLNNVNLDKSKGQRNYEIIRKFCTEHDKPYHCCYMIEFWACWFGFIQQLRKLYRVTNNLNTLRLYFGENEYISKLNWVPRILSSIVHIIFQICNMRKCIWHMRWSIFTHFAHTIDCSIISMSICHRLTCDYFGIVLMWLQIAMNNPNNVRN